MTTIHTPFPPSAPRAGVPPEAPAALLRQALRRIVGVVVLLLVTAVAHELALPAPATGHAVAPPAGASAGAAGDAVHRQGGGCEV